MNTNFVNAAAGALAAILIGGCAMLTPVVEPATDVVARGIDEACARGASPLGVEARRELVAAINSKTEVGNHTPSDCDGDGLPDFDIDADGKPVPAP